MPLLDLAAKAVVARTVLRRVMDKDDHPRAAEALRARAPAPARPAQEQVPDRREGAIAHQDQVPPSAPADPLQLPPDDWKATARRTLKEFKDDRVTLVAAGMAFYLFLAIFPALLATVGVFGLFELDPSGLIRSIRDGLPGGAGEPLTQAFATADQTSQGASLAAAISGIALALWSASSGFVAMQSGLNIAFEIDEDRKFVGKRAIGVVLLVATGLLGGVPSPLFTFGDTWYFTVLGWIATLVAVMVLFSIYYAVGPKRPAPSWQWVSPGGIVGAAIWIAVSLGFGYYVSNFADYGKTYGTFAGIIILIFWLYLSSIAVLLGGELNSELERQRNRRARGQTGATSTTA